MNLTYINFNSYKFNGFLSGGFYDFELSLKKKLWN